MADPRGPLNSPGFWLHHAALTWRRQLDTGLAGLGLTHTQFNLLASTNWLARGGERPTQQQVADMAGADRMMASKVISILEQRGLLTRSSHPSDTRAKLLHPTPAGHQLVLRAVRIVAEVDEAMFGSVGSHRNRLSDELRSLSQLDERG